MEEVVVSVATGEIIVFSPRDPVKVMKRSGKGKRVKVSYPIKMALDLEPGDVILGEHRDGDYVYRVARTVKDVVSPRRHRQKGTDPSGAYFVERSEAFYRPR